MPRSSAFRCLIGSGRRFLRDTSGTATVETVLWLPLLFGFFILVVDASMIFNERSRALQLVQNANRSYAIGRLATVQDLQSALLTEVRAFSPNATATATVANGTVTTTLIMPGSDLDVIGVLHSLAGINVAVTSQHMVETL